MPRNRKDQGKANGGQSRARTRRPSPGNQPVPKAPTPPPGTVNPSKPEDDPAYINTGATHATIGGSVVAAITAVGGAAFGLFELIPRQNITDLTIL